MVNTKHEVTEEYTNEEDIPRVYYIAAFAIVVGWIIMLWTGLKIAEAYDWITGN